MTVHPERGYGGEEGVETEGLTEGHLEFGCGGGGDVGSGKEDLGGFGGGEAGCVGEEDVFSDKIPGY